MKALITSLLILTATAAPALAGATKGTYRGTSTTHVYPLDVLTGKLSAPTRYNSTVVVAIGDPIRTSSRRESNSFSLSAYSAAPSAVGAVSLLSAYAGNAGSVNNFFLQYWTFSNTSNGFVGRLTNNGSSYGLAMNGVNARANIVPGRSSLGSQVLPFTFYDAKHGRDYQAIVNAKTTSKSLSMQVEGVAVAGSSLVYVVTTINASR